MIDFDDNKELRYVIANSQTPASKLFVDPIETSDNLEVCPQSAVVVDEVISRLSQQKSGNYHKFNGLNILKTFT